jgi:hypothetical protein
MTGLDPVIHGTAAAHGIMDSRVKPGHDGAAGASQNATAPSFPRRGEGMEALGS